MLNKQQNNLVECQAENKLGIAGAGTGKTHTMVEMIKEVIDDRIHPSRICCYTFTRAAGMEIKRRLEEKIGKEANEIFANTFHAFAIKVITENLTHVCDYWQDYKDRFDSLDFSIYDQNDRKDIINDIIKSNEFKVKYPRVEDVIKGRYEKKGSKEYEEIKVILKKYQQILFQNVALDLDFLIPTATALLQIEAIRDKYDYHTVVADEFQDSNIEQIKLIQSTKKLYFVAIGDEDQSIYMFSGARIEYILNFNEWFNNTEVITLEENYRSTNQIIKLANKITRPSETSTHKRLVAQRDGEEPILKICGDIENEVEEIYSYITENECVLKDCAILCRTNKTAGKIDDLLRIKGMNTNLITSQSDPLNADEVKNIVAYIKLALNPFDSYAFKKVMTFPERKLSDREIQSIVDRSIITESSFVEELPDSAFKTKFKEFQSNIDNYTGKEAFDKASNLSAIIPFLTQRELKTRIGVLVQARTKIAVWERYSRNKQAKSFAKWFMIKDIQEKTLDDADGVKIMTVHASKGLEFKHVFVPNLSHNQFPKRKADEDEERRILYVACTRPKETLMITCSERVATYGGYTLQFAGPSKFYNELTAE